MSSTRTKPLLNYSCFTPEQIRAIDRLYENDQTLLIASKGFGKCAVAWTAAQELMQENILNRVLVIAPPKVCALTWATEWAKWDHLDEPVMALGNEKQRRCAINGPGTAGALVVISADIVPWFVREYGRDPGFDGLIVDEISRFKAVGGAGMKALRRMIPSFEWRVGLSATPVAESGTHIYTQALIVDNGAALGRNKDKFLRRFFVPDYSGYNWEPQVGAEARLAEALAEIVWVAPDTDYQAQLPPLIEEELEVDMPPAACSAYEELAQTLILEAEDLEAANAAVLAGKLQQVASGFVYREDGSAVILHTEKYDMVRRLVSSLYDERVVIMYQFKEELKALRAMYPDAVVLADNPLAAQESWNAGEVGVMLIHPRSAGHGLNLQDGGHTLICLGPCWSSDQWDQVVGRLWRRGQKHAVTRYVLICNGTIDRSILMRLREKRSAEGILMNHLREVTDRQTKNPA